MKQGMKFFSMAILVVLFGACTANNDLYDPAKAEALVKGQYKKNFVKEFGEVPSDYSWDATSAYPRYGAITRGEGDYTPTPGENYYVPSETLRWILSNLTWLGDVSNKGTQFVMTVPGNEFAIVPIYQGVSINEWELHMVVGDRDFLLWKKGENIKISDGGGWGKEIQSTPLIFNLPDAAGQVMYFYLELTSGKSKGKRLSSLDDKKMLALKCPRPKNISEEKNVMVVGCEAADEYFQDMNDLVFMIVSDKEIEPIDIEKRKLVESVTKRYMIEDLGSTCDFDFNDIVVDVTQERIKKIEIVNGVIDESQSEYVGPITQKAIIRHLGGVLPFCLWIGTENLGEMEGQLGANPDSEFEVKGWDPEKNNITVKIGTEESKTPYTVEFPGDGEIPMIIAVDPDVQWMEEQKSITREWFERIQKK